MRWSGILVSSLLVAGCASVDPDWEVAQVEDAETGEWEMDEEVELAGPRCEARLAEEAETFFASSFTVWMPSGIEGFVEQNPFYATIRPSRPMALCADGSEAGKVQFGSSGYFEDDPTKPLDLFAEEVALSIYGEDLAVTSSSVERDETAQSRRILVELEVPPHPHSGDPTSESRAFLGLISGYGRMYWIMYESTVDDWAAVSPALRRSIKSVRLSP